MHLQDLQLSGNLTRVFVTTKAELSCFKHLAGGKKADIDERVVHLDYELARIWATDRRQLLAVTCNGVPIASSDLVANTSDLLDLLKPVKASDHVFIGGEGHVWHCDKAQAVANGDSPAAAYLGQLAGVDAELTATSCSNVLTNHNSPGEAGAAQFRMTPAFGAALSAVAKACKGSHLVIFNAPITQTSGMQFAMKNDTGTCEWRLIAMPLMPDAKPQVALDAQAETAAESP